MNKRISIFDKLVNITLPLSIILQTYGWGKYDFAFILINLLIIWGLFKKKIRFKSIPTALQWYIWYFLVVFYLSITPSSLAGLFPLGWIRIALSCGLFFSVIDKTLLLKYYSKITIICLTFFFIQIFLKYCIGYNISGIIPFLPIALSVEDINSYLLGMTSEESRCCSFFSEPAHFAQFLLPLLILKCFDTNKKLTKHCYIFSIIIALILLKSGNGVIGLAIVISSYVFWLIRKASLLKKIALSICLPIIIIGGVGIYIKSEAGETLMKRQDQLGNDMNADSGMSGFIRIYRGFYVYDALSTVRKIIGANSEVLIKQSINKSSVKYLFESPDDLYFNLIQTSLIRTGILGTILLMLVYWKLFKQGDIVGKTLIITLFVLGFVAAIYFKEVMYLYILMAWNSRKKSLSTANKNQYLPQLR